MSSSGRGSGADADDAIYTFTGTCDLTVLDMHDAAGIYPQHEPFLHRDEVEAVLKSVMERPTADKLFYSRALPCCMFTAPQRCVGHFLFACSSTPTLTNACRLHERLRAIRWKKSSTPSSYKCKLIKDAEIFTQIAVGTPITPGEPKCTARIMWISRYDPTTTQSRPTGLYFIQIRPSVVKPHLEMAEPGDSAALDA